MTFEDDAREFREAVTGLGHAIMRAVEPLVAWLSRRLPR